ncbi:hypothetical protein [Streptomyces sp. NWU339]|uniref:hypothetical protein n=1 Tax=Streptomyces sp. NWU339 TaxID=2185284 RepID=UPI0015E7F50D|nr:hypothetical protein [Streptomyces sp. NWU339]
MPQPARPEELFHLAALHGRPADGAEFAVLPQPLPDLGQGRRRADVRAADALGKEP